MVEFRGIRLNTDLGAFSKLNSLLEKLPLIIQGLHGNNFLSNDENPVTLRCSEEKNQSIFNCRPEGDSKVVVLLDSYLVREKGFECPGMDLTPRRHIPDTRYDITVLNEQYKLRIFPFGEEC